MSDLVSRVLAAIEEAERKALAVPEHLRRERWTHPGPWVMHGIESRSEDEVALVRMTGRQAEAIAEFIARNDPAAVLRRCAADRELLARGGPFCSCYEYGPPTNPNTGQSIPHHYDCSSYETASLLAGVYGISVEEETTGERHSD